MSFLFLAPRRDWLGGACVACEQSARAGGHVIGLSGAAAHHWGPVVEFDASAIPAIGRIPSPSALHASASRLAHHAE